MSKLAVTIDGRTYEVEISLSSQNGSRVAVQVNNEAVPVIVPNPDAPVEETEWLIIDGHPYEIVFDPDLHWIKACSGIHQVEVRDLEALITWPRSGDGRVKAPIPGLITRLLVEAGQTVDADQPLLVLEAMKMENEIRAPCSGIVSQLHVAAGQSVAHQALLCEIA